MQNFNHDCQGVKLLTHYINIHVYTQLEISIYIYTFICVCEYINM